MANEVTSTPVTASLRVIVVAVLKEVPVALFPATGADGGATVMRTVAGAEVPPGLVAV